MRTAFLPAALAATLLAACATTPTAEVTRFHLGEPIARSTVVLVSADPALSQSLEYRAYADAVARELAAQNFVVIQDERSAAYLGALTVGQVARPGRPKSSFSIGIGGGSFGRHGGVGGGVSAPIASRRPDDVLTTTLGLQLRRRSDSTIVWEGRAIGEAQGPAGDLPRAVPALAHALLADFPGARGQTVHVKLPA